jgi:Tfp pilus assembly protein PilN
VDPATFPLDQLAAIAAPTAGGKVRLISVTMENGHLQISGEATDVTQAYGFMESLKKSPILQQYDWTSGQPQLAGKNSVKFDMEGARAHANP